MLKQINLIYEIQLLSIFKEPWHRNNKYESLKIIITVLKRSGLVLCGNNSSCNLQKCCPSVHDVRSCSSRCLPLSFVFHTLPAILSIWTRSMHSGPLAELVTSGRATCSDSSGSGFRMVVHCNLWRATSSSKRQRSGKMIFCSSSSLKWKRSTLVIYL